eukprot:3873663-Rhodomonas_salina.1
MDLIRHQGRFWQSVYLPLPLTNGTLPFNDRAVGSLDALKRTVNLPCIQQLRPADSWLPWDVAPNDGYWGLIASWQNRPYPSFWNVPWD